MCRFQLSLVDLSGYKNRYIQKLPDATFGMIKNQIVEEPFFYKP